jgi:hypothetical protein
MQQVADTSTWPEQTPDSDFTINNAGGRVPPFPPEKPAVWFPQFEGNFVLSYITSDATKFYYASSQLDKQYEGKVEGVITNTRPKNVMTELKHNQLDVCPSSRSSVSTSFSCTRRWVTADRLSSSATSGLSPVRQYLQIFSELCGRIASRQIFRS